MRTSASTPDPSSTWTPTDFNDDESSLRWFAYDSTLDPYVSSGGPDLPCVCTVTISVPCAVCCDHKIEAVATAQSEDGCGALAYVQIMGPDGSIVEGVGSAKITYYPRPEECGTAVKFTAGASCQDGLTTATVDVVKATFDKFTIENGNPAGTQWGPDVDNGDQGMRLSIALEFQGDVSLSPAPSQLCGPQYELRIFQWVAGKTAITQANVETRVSDGPGVDTAFNQQQQPSDYLDGVLSVQASDVPGVFLSNAELEGQVQINPIVPLGIPVSKIVVIFNFTSALYIRCIGETDTKWRFLSQINWGWRAEVVRGANGQWGQAVGATLPNVPPIHGAVAPEPNNGPTMPELP